ncbi:cyanophycin synthetase [Salegentibacter echinorum]|uniref:Cyanophycin synthetase n=1 Tax=Salegentibacter echinorum TaxID=1073325 RepID=A0A1M5C6P0_SALEC|nr:cyanophycin synthetase [Salegentibacter echinorum]SHF50409.1 cyanophycin synthetase [Salegentibacter echinorum]
MKIREITALRGPNYYSVRRHKLIVMVLDLENLEEKPSNRIPGFYERLKKLLPSLQEHHCSEGHEGGFFERVKDGTWMGHIIEHIALEIQTLAGMDTGFGRTRSYGEEGVYNVVFSYEEENVGRYAAKASVAICEALIADEPYDLKPEIQRMREIRDRDRLGPSTGAIIAEAEKRGIPWIRLNENSLCQLGYGANQKRIQATVTSQTSSIGVELAGNKKDTKYMLKQAEIRVPNGAIVSKMEELEAVCEEIGFPVVVKPIGGNHGRGISVALKNLPAVEKAFKEAKKVSYDIIVEQQISGYDFRLLVINNQFIAASKRTPAHVVGDGKSTIKQLIKEKNKDPRRGYGHENVLTMISINQLTKTIIAAKGYNINSILKKDEVLVLKDTANLSTGGTAEDVTDIVHPENVAEAERISRIIDLDICGIDIMTEDISKPLSKTRGAVLEVNAGPGFRMHLAPTIGKARNVAEPVVEQLFPQKADTGKIPIIAVTGTNGKTTTTRLIAHMAKMSGCRVGYTTSDGVYIQNQLLQEGDCTGPDSSNFVLKDPTVNFAVMECARGGLLRAGLAFSQCDVGIVTNVSEDHLGLRGVHTIDQLARAKAVIPEIVMPEGYAILNADDDLVYAMRENISSKLALFSMQQANPRILELQELGGITAVYENGYVSLFKGSRKMRVIKAENIPLTFGGKATFMIQNILPAIIAAHVQNIEIQDIKAALGTFIPSALQTPGRLNLYEFQNFKVLLDYAHNRAGMRALKNLTDGMDASVKVGVIAPIGDRREEDNIEIGKIAAEMFDEIIIRLDKDLRGKSADELLAMVTKGIHLIKPNLKPEVISSETEAVKKAITKAQKNALIVVFCDDVTSVTKVVVEMKKEEHSK